MAVDGAHLLQGEACCILQVYGGGSEGLVGEQSALVIQTRGDHCIWQQFLEADDSQFLE